MTTYAVAIRVHVLPSIGLPCGGASARTHHVVAAPLARALPHHVPWAPMRRAPRAAALSVSQPSPTPMVPWPGQCPQVARFPLIRIITGINSHVLDWQHLGVLGHGGRQIQEGYGP